MLVRLLLICCLASLSACTYYQAAPATTAGGATTSKFDRSWAAATGAFHDQGVDVTREDRSAGVIEGTRPGIQVTGDVRRQADGSVRVAFDASGDTARDPDLLQRITASYQRRMGR